MKSKNIIIAFVIVLLLAGGVMAWRQGLEDTHEENGVSVVFISKNKPENNEFWSSIEEGVQMAVADYNIDITIMRPDSEIDTSTQNEMILSAIAMKPEAIVLVPSNYITTLPYAKQIEEAGIKLILLDSVMQEDIGVSVVTTNNYEGGYKMGEYLKYYADEDTYIGIIGHIKEASTAIERERGVRDGLEEYADRIVSLVYCDSDAEIGRMLTLELLAEHPYINMLVGLNEDSARGAAKAIEEMGMGNEIRLIGFDNSMEQIRLLEAGVFDAIVVQKPLNMGYLGIQVAYQAVKNEKIPESVDSGSVLITRNNLYTKENEKLLFPFREEN
jgi:ABC-type sugar transport system, periplasmic component